MSMHQRRLFSRRPKRQNLSRRALLAVLIAAVASFAAIAVALAASQSHPKTPHRSSPTTASAAGTCPKGTKPLPADAIARATEAALADAPRVYRVKNLTGMRAIKAVLATADDPGPGGYAKVKCGRAIQRRTVVVYLDFPAEPGASLRQGRVLIVRTASGFHTWVRLH
jgi:hypothetical protein